MRRAVDFLDKETGKVEVGYAKGRKWHKKWQKDCEKRGVEKQNGKQGFPCSCTGCVSLTDSRKPTVGFSAPKKIGYSYISDWKRLID